MYLFKLASFFERKYNLKSHGKDHYGVDPETGLPIKPAFENGDSVLNTQNLRKATFITEYFFPQDYEPYNYKFEPGTEEPELKLGPKPKRDKEGNLITIEPEERFAMIVYNGEKEYSLVNLKRLALLKKKDA